MSQIPLSDLFRFLNHPWAVSRNNSLCTPYASPTSRVPFSIGGMCPGDVSRKRRWNRRDTDWLDVSPVTRSGRAFFPAVAISFSFLVVRFESAVGSKIRFGEGAILIHENVGRIPRVSLGDFAASHDSRGTRSTLGRRRPWGRRWRRCGA